jgi:hypothetical protein
MMALYQLAVATKRSLLQAQPGSIASASVLQQPVDDPLQDFKPKNSENYTAHLTGRVLAKTRRHERLIEQYGTWAAARGFLPSTKEHPKDLVLRRNGLEWLVEAKVLYQGNATDAVRAALGQLHAYRHFLYQQMEPQLVALFSEPIGDGYVAFLEACGIASVWKGSNGWAGSTHGYRLWRRRIDPTGRPAAFPSRPYLPIRPHPYHGSEDQRRAIPVIAGRAYP